MAGADSEGEARVVYGAVEYSAGIDSCWPAETVTLSSAFSRTIASTTSRGSAPGATCSAIDHSDSPAATVSVVNDPLGACVS